MKPNPRALDAATRAHHASRTVVVGLLAAVWSLASPSPAHASLAVARGRRQAGDLPRPLRHLRRAGRAHRPVLDGAHPAGEDRAQAAPSAVRGHPHAVPAVAGVRRAALADRLAVGVLEAGGYKLAYGTDKHPDYFKEHGLPEPANAAADLRAARGARSKDAACRPSELDAIRADLAALESRLAASDVGGEVV